MNAEAEAWKSWPLPEPGTTLRRWQDSRCAWCGYTDRLNRDHCHTNGLVRGLLCSHCNQMEGNAAEDSAWKAWRSGDNPARAIGHFEVYLNHIGRPVIHPTSALGYYTEAERDEWWASIEATFPNEWPVPPWTVQATARREADVATMRAAVNSLSADLLGGAA